MLEPHNLDVIAWGLIDDSTRALHSIYRKAQDDTWLDKQGANDLAVLAGVISDKLIRILGAFEPVRTAGSPIA